LEDPDNQVLFSAASIWELSIKLQIGRLDLPLDLAELVDAAEGMGFEELPIASRHTMGVQRLPLHHRDPFDRILIAQAVYEPARFLTMDKLLARYSELVEVVG
jgi:PIN domain nuclease of toxin-antitoxin system